MVTPVSAQVDWRWAVAAAEAFPQPMELILSALLGAVVGGMVAVAIRRRRSEPESSSTNDLPGDR